MDQLEEKVAAVVGNLGLSASLIVSVICLTVAVVLATIRFFGPYKSGRFFTPVRILIAGMLLAGVAFYIPVYLNKCAEEACGEAEAVLMSVFSTIKLFIIDGEYNTITDNIKTDLPFLFRCYTIYGAALFLFAPCLTATVVLSFFKNIYAYIGYAMNFNSDVYILSELNEESLALAESLRDNYFVERRLYKEKYRRIKLCKKITQQDLKCKYLKKIPTLD